MRPGFLLALAAALALYVFTQRKSGPATLRADIAPLPAPSPMPFANESDRPLAAPLLKRFEGLRLAPYKDSGGLWHIGYGHKIVSGEPYYPFGELHSITQAQADQLLQADILRTWGPAKTSIRVVLSPQQIAALQSLVFNIGPLAFVKSSMPALLNSLAFAKAADAFLLFNKYRDAAGKLQTSAGLTLRRQAERQLFLS